MEFEGDQEAADDESPNTVSHNERNIRTLEMIKGVIQLRECLIEKFPLHRFVNSKSIADLLSSL